MKPVSTVTKMPGYILQWIYRAFFIRFPACFFTCCLLLLLFHQQVSASFIFRNFTTEQGLPSSDIYDVIQDRKGYIWAATSRGVSRYDGYTFKTYTTRDGLVNNTVFKIFEDRKGRIWFTSVSGGLCWYEQGHIYHHPANDRIRALVEKKYINCLYIDAQENLWFTLEWDDAKIYRIGTDYKITSIDGQGHASLSYQVFLRTIDDQGYVYANNPQLPANVGSRVTRSGADTRITFCLNPGSPTRSNCIRLHNGSYLCALNNQLLQFKDTTVIYSDCNRGFDIIDLFEDKSHNIWISGAEGLFLYPKGNLAAKGMLMLDNHSVTRVIEDHEGGFWVSTLSHGLFYLPSATAQHINIGSGLKDERITAIEANGSQLWFATYEGYLYTLRNNKEPIEVHAGARYHLSGLLLDQQGTLWTSTHQRIRNNKSSFYFPGLHNIKSLKSTRNGDILVCSGAGFSRMRQDKVIFNSLDIGFSNWVTAIHEDASGNTWIGTHTGMYLYQKGRIRFMGAENKLYTYSISDITESPGGTLYIATHDAGILVKKGNTLYPVEKKDGLASDIIEKVLFQGDSVLWVATYQGIGRVVFEKGSPPRIRSIRNYTVTDGLPSNEVNDMGLAGDWLWIATNKGLGRFHTAMLVPGEVPPPLYISSVRINDRDTLLIPSYSLAAGQNNIRVDFLAISLHAPGRISYRYRLDSDTAWQFTPDRTLRYTNLPPGTHTLLLAARNGHGEWTSIPLQLRFDVATHFTGTVTFLVMVFIAAVSAVTTVAYLLIRNHQRRNNIKRDILRSEQKALLAQMNPHFIFNALNSLLSFILENEKTQAVSYLTRFSSLIRRTLENSRSNLISLEEELSSIRLYLELEQLRFGNRFTYEIQLDPGLSPGELQLPSMMVQPFIENAIWHGIVPLARQKEGLLLVIFRIEDQHLVCVVEDNGIGRTKAAEIAAKRKNHNSTGIKNITERLQLLNQLYRTDMQLCISDLEDKNNQASGTRVTLQFPASF